MNELAKEVLKSLLEKCLFSVQTGDVEKARKWIDCIEYLYDILDTDVKFFGEEEDFEEEGQDGSED